MTHDVGSATKGADGHATANHFAEAGKIGLDVEKALSTVGTKTKTRHHLVEDQHAAVLRAKLAHAF